ncbi:MAG: transporter [bacterium]
MEKRQKTFLKLLSFFIVFFTIAILSNNLQKAYAGADGSGNNFFFKGPVAFGVIPPNKFITSQGLTYTAFGSKFLNSGASTKISSPISRFVFLPEFMWTKKIFNVTNFFEVVTPFGSAVQHQTNLPTNTNYQNNGASGGIGDFLLFYGIFSNNYSFGNLSLNFFPQISITIPTGQWSSNSSVNMGGNEWQIMPALAGQIAYKLPANQMIALDYAVGYSYNEGHSTVNIAEVDNGDPSFTNPGNNYFADIYLNYFILPNLNIYNETSYVKQSNNYGYQCLNNANCSTTPSDIQYGLVNKGYQDVASGFGIDYHVSKTMQIDGRILHDLHGENGPNGYYSMIDVIMAF